MEPRWSHIGALGAFGGLWRDFGRLGGDFGSQDGANTTEARREKEEATREKPEERRKNQHKRKQKNKSRNKKTNWAMGTRRALRGWWCIGLAWALALATCVMCGSYGKVPKVRKMLSKKNREGSSCSQPSHGGACAPCRSPCSPCRSACSRGGRGTCS